MPVDPLDIAVQDSVDIPHNHPGISRLNYVQYSMPNKEQKCIVHFRKHSVQESYCFMKFKGGKIPLKSLENVGIQTELQLFHDCTLSFLQFDTDKFCDLGHGISSLIAFEFSSVK